MKVKIKPSCIFGELNAVESKSHLHRLLICSALCSGDTKIFIQNDISEDVKCTINCLCALGAEVSINPGGIILRGIKNVPEAVLMDCGESGSTLRFMLPVASILSDNVKYFLKPSLASRPIDDILIQLEKHGCKVSRLPICISGKLHPGKYEVSGNISSQFLSGFLMALPMLNKESCVVLTTELGSAGYVEMTCDVLNSFGVKVLYSDGCYSTVGRYISKGSYTPEGDWTQSAAILFMAAVSGFVRLKGVRMDSLQRDKECVEILRRMNARVTIENDAVIIAKNDLCATEIDACDIPDIVPYVAAAALHAEGITVIKNVDRLKYKESNRIEAIISTISKLGGKIRYERDKLEIFPSHVHFAQIKCDDHRIAMAVAIATINCGCEIEGAECVNKSYPQFWDHIRKLGAEVDEIL